MAYDVQNGNNMPVQAPLIPDPLFPTAALTMPR